MISLKNGNLVSFNQYGSVYIWDVDNGYYTYPLNGGGPFDSLNFLPNGNFITSDVAYGYSAIYIWDKNDFNLITSITIPIRCLTILRNGYFAGTDPDDLIRIWDGGSLKRTIVTQSNYVYSLAELQNGLLAGGVNDNSIKIWNVTDGLLKKKLTGNNGTANILLVLRNGFLASTSPDNTIKIWNTDTGLLLKTLIEPGSINRIFQLSKNDYLYSYVAGKMRIWNTDTGGLVKSLDISTFFAFNYLKNGNLATGSSNKIQIWN